MIESNYYEDNQDLQFNLDHFIDWQTIVPLKENEYADAAEYQKSNNPNLEFAPSNVEEAIEMYREVFKQYGEISGKEVAPAAGEMDKSGLKFDKGKVTFPEKFVSITDIIAQSGIIGYSVSREYGGLNMPLVGHAAILEMLARADGAFGINIGCFNLAEVIERFGNKEMKDSYIPKMAAGEMTGAMALTEPDYGSDLPNILTKAVKKEDGTYEIEGTKRFITHGCGIGDKPAAILTLARSGGNGAKGLSFFLVESGDVEIARIEEKMGLHCSPTCEVVYDKSKAILIGEEGKGLVKYAMDMMNGARLGIAIQSLGISQAAYEEARLYASQREQFGSTIDQIPAVKRILTETSAKLHALRALNYQTAQFVDIYEGLRHKLEKDGKDDRAVRKDPEVLKYDKLSRIMTPVSKLISSEESNKIAYDCLQIFGGAGYTEEYDASKIYRDARITTIYEGTTQLQVVAAIGGVVEGMRDNAILKNWLQETIDSIENAESKGWLNDRLQNLVDLVPVFKALEKEQKDTYALEMVMYYSYFFAALALAKQIDVAVKADHPIAGEKKQAIKVFKQIADSIMRTSDDRVRSVPPVQ